MTREECYSRWMTKEPCPQCGGPKSPRSTLCRKCERWRNQGPDGDKESELRRFWSKVKVTEGCWIWQAGSNGIGYGAFHIKRDGEWTKILAHVYCYQVHKGPVPNGLELDHLCRNPPCVNPQHLEPVTKQVNVIRGNAGAANWCRKKTHCLRGHPFDATNTYLDKRGRRGCKICRREQSRISNQKARKRYKEEHHGEAIHL